MEECAEQGWPLRPRRSRRLLDRLCTAAVRSQPAGDESDRPDQRDEDGQRGWRNWPDRHDGDDRRDRKPSEW